MQDNQLRHTDIHMARGKVGMWRNETDQHCCRKDYSCDEENLEACKDLCNITEDMPPVGGLKQHLRSKRIQELVATERDYVNDLDALIHVADRNRTSITNPHILLGNTQQVLGVSRQLLHEMEELNRKTEKERELGQLFLNYEVKLTQVYREYCSYYSVRVLPLLNKYEEDEKAKKELKQLAKDLNSLRPDNNSFNAALIKPVQRILRYSLYLEHLLEDTPSTHPERSILQEARTRLAIVATHINEHTRGLDLALKDYSEVENSLHGRMRRVSLHSLAKRSFRMSTILSQRLGIADQVGYSEFEDEKAKFYSIQRAAIALAHHSTAILKAVRAMHISELLVSEALYDIMQASCVESIKEAACGSYDSSLKAFDTAVVERVLRPVNELTALFEVSSRVIKKYHHKRLDCDASNSKKSAKGDVNSTDTINVGEKNRNLKIYQALESLLQAELPVLTIHGLEVIIAAFQSLITARLYLQGRMTHIYLQLAQAENFVWMETMALQTRTQQQMEWLLRQLPLSLQKNHIVKDHHGTESHKTKKATNESKKKNPPAQRHVTADGPTFYADASKEKTYTALYSFIAEDDTQLSLHPGMKVVPILEDTAGGWWFVKAIRGGRGYVPAAYLSHE